MDETKDTKMLLSVREAAALIGLTASRMYVRVAQGAIPGVVRLGGRIYLKRAVLQAWLTSSVEVEKGR